MKVGFFYHPIFLQHDSGPGHPESRHRLEAILRALETAPFFEKLYQVSEFPERAPESLYTIHDKSYVDWVKQQVENGATLLDFGDTRVNELSYAAALKATDAAVEAAMQVWEGKLDRAFVAPRPPGHHAERNRAIGFCIFNNIAVAAAYLLKDKASRVAIVDWDVHHGNGTQTAFYSDPRVLFISLHQFPHYPGTGPKIETGEGDGEGTTINIPMRPGWGDDEYIISFDEIVIPAIDEFAPEMILISAGFDAHTYDPLSSINISTETYAKMTRCLCDAADRRCNGRIVSILEGGYHLQSLSEAVVAHINALSDNPEPD